LLILQLLLLLLELVQPLVEQPDLLPQGLDLRVGIVRPAQRDQTGQQCHGREHAADIRPPNTQNGSRWRPKETCSRGRRPRTGLGEAGYTVFQKSVGFHIA
jgi:hypothetical protein